MCDVWVSCYVMFDALLSLLCDVLYYGVAGFSDSDTVFEVKYKVNPSSFVWSRIDGVIDAPVISQTVISCTFFNSAHVAGREKFCKPQVSCSVCNFQFFVTFWQLFVIPGLCFRCRITFTMRKILVHLFWKPLHCSRCDVMRPYFHTMFLS